LHCGQEILVCAPVNVIDINALEASLVEDGTTHGIGIRQKIGEVPRLPPLAVNS
jgi:hypothetical protein